MSENKLVKTFLEAATLNGLAASIGWIAKKQSKKTSLQTQAAMR